MKRPLAVLMLAAFIVPFAGGARCAFAAERVNILHIHADDHRADGLRALGSAQLQTPNLDALVQNGFVFTHCYTQGSMIGAVCLPSRTMMLSGRSWQRIPKQNEGNPAELLPGVMKAAGYSTFHVGKGGNEYTAGLKAFETNLVFDDRGDARRGSSERHADAAIKFLASSDTSKPFYIYLAPPVPHDPRISAPEFHKLYDPAKTTLSPAFLPLHPFNNGALFIRDEMLAPFPRTEADTRQHVADYYACVTGLDHHVGRIFEALRKSGEWENTIVVFTGDNGLSLGEHGLFGKQNCYEHGGLHVPLVIAGPGIPHGKSEALVYLLDLFPTFCELTGAKPPSTLEGHSLVPVMNGKTSKVREVLYTGYSTTQRTLRDERWKLMRYPEVNVTQLFDLQSDRLEQKNLADDPAQAGRVKEMLAALQKEMNAYDDKAPLTVPNPKPAAWSPNDVLDKKEKTKAKGKK